MVILSLNTRICDHIPMDFAGGPSYPYGMMRLLALLFTFAVMNAALILSVAHDGVVASQQLAMEAAAGQEAEPSSAPGNASCMLSGSCSSDGTACDWTCASHAAVETASLQDGAAQHASRLERLFAVSSWRTTGPLQQERPPRTLSV
ncbi:hypothetical protein SAMN04244548_02880 [Paracoccus pantotrophus]|nr:hypothetical protein SAMN04244548_02880 [Paracoccus pantotrophus]